MSAPVLEPGKGTKWRNTVRALVHELEDKAPKSYDGKKVAPYTLQQSTPGPTSSSVYSDAALDLIVRPFLFTANRKVLVRLTRVAFVNFLRALRDEPSIEVGFGTGYFASHRSYVMQKQLYDNYRNGGPLAAPPGHSWHHRCAVDLTNAGPAGSPVRDAMEAHGFFGGLTFGDPPHHTFGRVG